MEDILGTGFNTQGASLLDSTPPAGSPVKKYSLIPDITDFNGTIDDVDQGVHNYIWAQHRALYVTSWVVSSVVCTVLLILELLYLPSPFGGTGRTDIRIFLLPFAIFLWPVSIYARFKSQMQHMFMQQIAQVLGFTYEPTGNVDALPGNTFKIGRARKIEDVVSGMYQSYLIGIFNYTFTVGSGKSSHTETDTIFGLTFGGILPDILLTPTINNMFLGLSESIDASPSGDVAITLEGDFNKHFSLYAPKNYEMEIREIFQPDLMAELIDSYTDYRVELAGNKMYVIAPLINNREKFLAALNLIEKLFVRIAPYLKEVGT